MLLDLGGFVPSDGSVVRHMQAGTAAAAGAFAEVWVLWRGIAYPTWRNGAANLATR